MEEKVCPICGEPYWREIDTSSFEETRLSSCKCNRIHGYHEEFLKLKGLEKEFEEFVKSKEKPYWYSKIIETFQSGGSVDEILDEFGKVSSSITACMSTDEILEAVSKGLSYLDNAGEVLEHLVDGLANILGINTREARKIILAMAL